MQTDSRLLSVSWKLIRATGAARLVASQASLARNGVALSGRVSDAATGFSLAGARVTAVSTGQETFTGEAGGS